MSLRSGLYFADFNFRLHIEASSHSREENFKKIKKGVGVVDTTEMPEFTGTKFLRPYVLPEPIRLLR